MNIKIIALGKIKEKYLKLAIDEFLKRIRPYSSIQIVEIQDEPIYSNSTEEQARKIEAKKIFDKLSPNSFVVVLDIKGQSLSSEAFAQKIKSFSCEGLNSLTFIIGSSTGLDDSVKQAADYSLSLSEMTFTHQFARLMLLKQLYRAFKILNNETYHK
jgi:23S rRNA (pseudouridine1915-N3)-methyltransferase